MRYAVIVFIDTKRRPQAIVNEIVSNLDFDNQEVISAIVLTNKGRQVAIYDKEKK